MKIHFYKNTLLIKKAGFLELLFNGVIAYLWKLNFSQFCLKTNIARAKNVVLMYLELKILIVNASLIIL